uniref:Uncharacterized protein n=1 Tax=Glossina pallidipes TaxID=7398 RepID=A0A1A9Z386_GLOPL
MKKWRQKNIESPGQKSITAQKKRKDNLRINCCAISNATLHSSAQTSTHKTLGGEVLDATEDGDSDGSCYGIGSGCGNGGGGGVGAVDGGAGGSSCGGKNTN